MISITIVHYAVAVIIIVVGLADWHSTNKAIAAGGSEANPVMRLAMELGNKWILPKMGIHAILATAVVWAQIEFMSGVMFGIMCGLTAVVINNYKIACK